MNIEYNSSVSSKKFERLLKNLKNTTGDYFFAAPCIYDTKHGRKGRGRGVDLRPTSTGCQYVPLGRSVVNLRRRGLAHDLTFYSASAERCISYDRFCLTVRLSHAGIMPKRLQLRSCGLH